MAVSVGPAESRDAGYDREDPEDVAVTVTDVGFRDVGFRKCLNLFFIIFINF